MLNLYIGYCQKLYTQHCHFLYIVNLLITSVLQSGFDILPKNTIAEYQMAITSKEHKTGSFFIKNNFEGESWVK